MSLHTQYFLLDAAAETSSASPQPPSPTSSAGWRSISTCRRATPTAATSTPWLACSGATSAPRPVTRREDTLLEETFYEQDLLPVCSPALLAARGPADLQD